MKRKPGWFGLIILIFILTTGIPSCSCDGPDYAAIRDIQEVIVFDWMQNKIIDVGISTTSDQLAIIILNEIQFFSLLEFHIPGTMSEAWACDPSPPQIANQIVDIKVLCDQNFNGIPPQTNFAEQLQFGPNINLQSSLHLFLATLPKVKDNSDDFDYRQFQIFLNSKPEPGTYRFTIELIDNNGHIFSGITKPIQWM